MSDFSPTIPNPGAGGLPGALIFAGYGTGRENTHTLVEAGTASARASVSPTPSN